MKNFFSRYMDVLDLAEEEHIVNFKLWNLNISENQRIPLSMVYANELLAFEKENIKELRELYENPIFKGAVLLKRLQIKLLNDK